MSSSWLWNVSRFVRFLLVCVTRVVFTTEYGMEGHDVIYDAQPIVCPSIVIVSPR